METTTPTKRKQHGGWTPKPFEERKVKVWAYVKRKHHKEAQDKITLLAKAYR